MAETTIEWTATRGPDGTMHKGFTHNAWIGCEEVDPDPEHPGGPSECDNCYARRGSARLGAQHHLQLWPKEPGGPSDRFFTGADYQKRPYAWNRKAAKLGVRLKVFAASYSDVAEDREDLVERRTQLGRTILETPWLDYLLLTKRPENMIRLFAPVWPGEWPRNVWAGTSVGVKPSLARVEHLRNVPAAVRFLSMEPLLEEVPLDHVFGLEPGKVWADCLCDEIDPSDRPCVVCEIRKEYGRKSGIHWVIGGGESGSKARPFDVDAARRLRDVCKAAGVAFFMKQLGAVVHCATPQSHEWPTVAKPEDVGGRWRMRLKDSHGGDWSEWPEDLRVREYPESAMTGHET